MNELKVFNDPQFGTVRTILKDGEPWFVAADVCNYFAVTNRNRVMQAVDDCDKGGTQMDTPGGRQEVTIINESGLYTLLFALQPARARGVSEEYVAERTKQIKAFKHWVTHEVLPAIRKHGGYLTAEKVEEALLNPDVLIRLATELKDEREARRALESKVAEDAPKVLFAKAVEQAENSILVGDLAKLIKQNGTDIGQKRLFARLRAEGYLGTRGENYNMPTQRAMEMQLFHISERTINNPDGSVRLTRTVKVTGKGQVYFINRYAGGDRA